MADCPTFGIAGANGCLELYTLSIDDDGTPTTALKNSTLVKDGILMLSLDWSNRKHQRWDNSSIGRVGRCYRSQDV